MITPTTLTYQRWLDLYAVPATSLTISYGAAPREHAYRLDLSSGSYAVEAHDWSKQFTPECWINAIRSGTRDTAGVEQAEWELVDAL